MVCHLFQCVEAHPHRVKANTKAKKIKNNRKRSKKKIQTSKKVFGFAFVFAWCESALRLFKMKHPQKYNLNPQCVLKFILNISCFSIDVYKFQLPSFTFKHRRHDVISCLTIQLIFILLNKKMVVDMLVLCYFGYFRNDIEKRSSLRPPSRCP